MSDVTVNVNVKGNIAKRKQYYTGDIPDGAVSMSKLAPDVTVIIEGNENDIDELREDITDIQSSKADKTELAAKADKTELTEEEEARAAADAELEESKADKTETAALSDEIDEEAEARIAADAALEQNKADKTALNDYYTKTETDAKIAEAKSIIPKRHIVDVLPTENVDTNDTYLVPADDPDTNNAYIEYAYINGSWEIIGSPFEVDLSNYYEKNEVDDKLNDKADKANEEGGFVGGLGTSTTMGGAAGHGASSTQGGAIGNNASTATGGAAGQNAFSNGGGAIGEYTSATDGGAIGSRAFATTGGAVGSGSKAGAGFAGGYNAKCATGSGSVIDAIQLGTGTNSVSKSVQAYNYTLMNADGSIPTERLSGYYTKTETDTKIAEAKSIIPKRYIVNALPMEGIDINGTYLVPAETPNENNLYDEYAYINGAWEIIGSAVEVDLSGYYTKTETDNKFCTRTTADNIVGNIETVENDVDEALSRVNAAELRLDDIEQGDLLDLNNSINNLTSQVEGKVDTTDLTAETSARTAADAAINSTLSDLNETVLGHGNAVFYLENNAQLKPTITTKTGSTVTVSMDNNTETRCGEVTALALNSFGSQTPEGWDPNDLISSVVFTSGATATSLTYPDTITMIGTDCIDGVFAPVANKRYTLIVAYDGAGLVGTVGGYEI